MIFWILLSQAFAVCPDTMFSASGVCKPCHYNCGNCFKGKDDVSDGCIDCLKDYFIFEFDNCYDPCEGKTNCIICHASCAECSGNEIYQCTRCDIDYGLYQGRCYSECPTNTYMLMTLCKECDISCNGCTGDTSEECLNCAPDYYYNSNKCIKAECGNGILEINEECEDGNSIGQDGCTNCKIDEPGCQPPRIIDKYYSENFSKFIIKFDENIAVLEDDCEIFLNYDLFGVDSHCVYNDNYIEIQFGKNPNLIWSDEIKISNNTVKGECDRMTGYFIYPSGFDHDYSGTLYSTEIMGKCDLNLDLNLQILSTRNRKLVSIKWSIYQILPLKTSDDFRNYKILSDILNKNSNMTHTYIPNKNLQLGKTYIIKATVYNFLGQSLNLYSQTETKNIESPVFLSFGFTTLYTNSETDLYIRADAVPCGNNTELIFD